MKQYLKFIFLMLLFICMLSSFSLPSKKTSIRGYIKVYGNEPFAYLGIETTDGKQYKLEYSEQKELYPLQGQLVIFEGIIKKSYSLKKKLELNSLKDGTFIVDSYSIEEF